MIGSMGDGWSRRKLIAAAVLAPLVAGRSGRALAAAAGKQISAADAQKRLMAGNARYASGASLKLDHVARREAVALAQMPFAIVLGCSDSRVPPEILFDQGLGDVFTIRVAGNVADDLALGSMEYAVAHFGTPLIVVLGHQSCGAVAATVDSVKSGTMPPPHIASLVEAIKPAVMDSQGMAGDPVENAITANVKRTVAALKTTGPVLADAVTAGHLTIIGAEYHLKTGRVGLVA